jgi:hypothetical protein
MLLLLLLLLSVVEMISCGGGGDGDGGDGSVSRITRAGKAQVSRSEGVARLNLQPLSLIITRPWVATPSFLS